jgi:acetyl esterase/lipase
MNKHVQILILLFCFSSSALAERRVEKNVVYGMYSGLALLMDIYHPEKPNGYGVVLIMGSGWHMPPAYGGGALKDRATNDNVLKTISEAGYTVFAINHRAAPRFRYPAAVEDAQRAVRFVRHHAKQYGITPDRIGGVGGSSGGHLVSMLGTLDGKGDPEDPDPINRESSRLQCVVARAAPSDLAKIKTETGLMAVTSFVGVPSILERKTYQEVSPVTHASAEDAPFLMIHGDADNTVPFEQSELMEAALKKSGVEVKLIRIPGGGHGGNFDGATNPPDYLGETVRWLNRHLGVSK